MPFLLRVYASTRDEELALTGWDEGQKSAFLTMQFNAQHRHYHEYFPAAAFDIIVVGGEDAGRLYVHRSEGEIRLIDIALLPEHRNRGVGSALLRPLLEEARAGRQAVVLHVEQNNRAVRLYTRLGFKSVQFDGMYGMFVWRYFVDPAVG